jgi:hypothetical protein
VNNNMSMNIQIFKQNKAYSFTVPLLGITCIRILVKTVRELWLSHLVFIKLHDNHNSAHCC